jgi:hypothetical protein
MSGTVGLIADTLARYTFFYQCLTQLQLPPNTVLDYELGADRGRSRNNLVRRSLERGSEWILFLDDDHTFSPMLLKGLLSRELPVVASLYLRRSDPFFPIAYAEKDENGDYWPLNLEACPPNGLVTVVGVGTGGMLIRSEVFHELEEPWFVHTTKQSEDLYFCDRVVEAGIPIYVDLEARLGHIAPFSIFPAHEKGSWRAGVAVSGSMNVHLPLGTTEKEEISVAN